MINELMTHLWQSTLFAIVAALLTLVFRKNRAKVRFTLWLSASLKFFIPFALLMNIGSHIQWTPATHEIVTEYATPAVSLAVEYVAEPFSPAAAPSSVVRRNTAWLPTIILSLWACGFLAIVAIRLNLWRRVQAAVHASTPLDIPATVGVRSAPGLLEPGVVGLLKPVLLLPEGIVDRLTPSQLEAVLAHELCHVRRRDNLFATVHMIVEALFWFHPLVWWIGARLVEERERACDEDVLNLGNQPRVYADAILNVCKLYTESPLVCVSGVTGANIRRRIEAIMTNRRGQTLNRAKKILLAAAGLAALAGPVVVGIVIGIGHVPAILAQSPVAAQLLPQLTVPTIAQSVQATPVSNSSVAAQSVATAPAPVSKFGDRRLVVMLFDLSGMSAEELSRTQAAGLAYVRDNIQPGDVVTIMGVTGDSIPVVLQDFTDNAASLQAAVQSAIVEVGRNVANNSGVRIERIATVSKMLAAFPQKKALIYFSTGIADAGADQSALHGAVNAAKQANVAIFPIDVRPVAATPDRAQLEKFIDAQEFNLQQLHKQYDDKYPAIRAAQMQLDAYKAKLESLSEAHPVMLPSGGGRSMTPQVPTSVSQEEYNKRLAYAQSKFGVTATSPMARSYARYGAPDQIENSSATTQIWRYKYLDDFQGNAAFEFSGQLGARVVYPPPLATYAGHPGQASQFAPFAEALLRDSPTTGKTAPTDITPGLPGRHVSLQVDPVSPGMPPATGKFAASFTVPLDSLSGQVDIAGQVRTRLETGGVGQMAGALRDTVPASAGAYQAAFTLSRGAWTLNLLVRELATGRMFDETVNFDVK